MRMDHYKEKVRKSALVLSWGLYDLANQFFALNIASLYFVKQCGKQVELLKRYLVFNSGLNV